MQGVRYPPIAEVAQPMLRLAGGRIDVNTNGPHLAPYFVSYVLKRLPGGEDIHVALPSGAKAGPPVWSHDGKQFAFTNLTSHGIELWLAVSSTGTTRRIAEHVNAVRVSGDAAHWLPDNRTLIATMVPAGRGNPPAEPLLPKGPHIQESLGTAGPAPTYEDLLSNAHDEDLFDYYATAQLVYIDATTGRQTPFAKPGIFTVVQPSPDGQHLLVGQLHKPYSYSLPAQMFPQDVEIWDRNGKGEYKVASLPMADHVPLAGVRTGPRSYQWLPDKPATLAWVEALDGGNPRERVPHRDKVVVFSAPFTGQPRDVFQTEERFRNLQVLAGGKALVQDFERIQRSERTLAIDLENPSAPARLVFSRNERDAYRDPGRLIMRTSSEGRRQAMQIGEDIFLTGEGASPAGDKPFLDRFNLATGRTQRLFQSASGYEEIVDVLDDAGTRLLTRRESPRMRRIISFARARTSRS
jgi:dipeptidyl aminopeptidase/acylaminoacyl peptidase